MCNNFILQCQVNTLCHTKKNIYKSLIESQVQSLEPFMKKGGRHFGCAHYDFLYKTIELWLGNFAMSCTKFFERDIHKFYPILRGIEKQ
jgi:hypothetical protein